MNIDWTPATAFTAVILAVIAVVYVGALVRFAVWFIRSWIAEDRRRQDAARNVQAGGFVPQGTVIDGSGNVRVIRREQS